MVNKDTLQNNGIQSGCMITGTSAVNVSKERYQINFYLVSKCHIGKTNKISISESSWAIDHYETSLSSLYFAI